MAEKKKNSQKKTTGGKGRWANLNKTSKILYTVAVIVILVPLLFLGYIYISAKENSGKPTVGSRFDDSLNPAITEQQLEDVKKAVVFDGTDKVEMLLMMLVRIRSISLWNRRMKKPLQFFRLKHIFQTIKNRTKCMI